MQNAGRGGARVAPPTSPMRPSVHVTLAVLAGGASTRMGRNKALLPVRGRPLIAHIIERLRPLADEVIVVARDAALYAFLGVPVATDRYPGIGPLAGLHAALAEAHGDLVALVACDMPFVKREVFAHLIALAPGVDVVMPRVGGREEPLHAVYRRPTCLPAVEATIAQGGRRLIAFLPQVRVRYVDEDELRALDPGLESFANVNTPAEWEEAVRRLEVDD